MRSEFSKKTKLQSFARSGGICDKCGCKLMPGKIEYDHTLPCAFGGTADLSNCMVLCRACHRAKTSNKDIPAIRKSDRVRAKHIGATKPHRAMPGSRASGWKRKFDGTVVRRSAEAMALTTGKFRPQVIPNKRRQQWKRKKKIQITGLENET